MTKSKHNKKHKFNVLTLIIILVLLVVAFLAIMSVLGKGKLLVPVPKKDVFMMEQDTSYLDPLKVEGTKIYNDKGEQFIFKGLMVPELERLSMEGDFNKEYFDEVCDTGVNAIRIPVHPESWANDEYYLWRYLDKAVEWSVENNTYVIIDLHFIGNVLTGEGSQMRDVGEDAYQFSIDFWQTISSYFKDVPNVIYEIYNEPTAISDADWMPCANKLVDTIRNTGSNQLIIVSGTDYSYNLSAWENTPMQKDNIAYSAHIYPNRIGAIEYFDKISDTLPIIVSEWGYIAQTDTTNQQYLIGTKEKFGQPMIEFMDNKEIGWVACWYDNKWEPPMFSDNKGTPTEWGEFILDIIKNK